jgi:hypothetical protein
LKFYPVRDGNGLTSGEFRSIGQKMVNGSAELSAKVASIDKQTPKATGLKAASKVLSVLVFCQIAGAAAQGYSQGSPDGQTGALGAGEQVMRETMMAEVVEGLVFPLIGKAADGVENGLTNGQGIPGAAASIAGRLNSGFDPVTGAPLPQTGPNLNAFPHVPQPAQPGSLGPMSREELDYLDWLFENMPWWPT